MATHWLLVAQVCIMPGQVTAPDHQGILEQAQRLEAGSDPLFVHGVPIMLPKPAKVPFVARGAAGEIPHRNLLPPAMPSQMEPSSS